MKSLFSTRTSSVAAMLIVLAALSFVLAGCARKPAGQSADSASGGRKTIGFSQMENDGPWRIAETNSMKEEASKRAASFNLVVTDAQKQTSKQVSDVEDLIARHVDAIFLAPKEFEGLAPALQAAKEAKIPVFLIDREAAGKAGEDYVAFIGSNFIEQGRRAGEWLAQKSNGKANIVELTGTAGASVARDRKQGFMNEIGKHTEMHVIASQDGDFSRAKAQSVMQNIIQAKGKEISAVYAHNDEMAIGAIQALKAAGMKPGTDVLIVSVDGEKDALKAIIAGDMNVTIESNPRFGPLAFDTLEKYLRGEKPPTKIMLEDRLFDASNAQQFLNEAY